jgi:hypothetical protein
LILADAGESDNETLVANLLNYLSVHARTIFF